MVRFVVVCTEIVFVCRIKMSDVMENKKVAKEAEFGEFLEMLVDWIKAKKNMFKKEKWIVLNFG